MSDKTDRATGQAKEKLGRATRNPSLEREGKDEQSKGKMKQGLKSLKDAFKKQG